MGLTLHCFAASMAQKPAPHPKSSTIRGGVLNWCIVKPLQHFTRNSWSKLSLYCTIRRDHCNTKEMTRLTDLSWTGYTPTDMAPLLISACISLSSSTKLLHPSRWGPWWLKACSRGDKDRRRAGRKKNSRKGLRVPKQVGYISTSKSQDLSE